MKIAPRLAQWTLLLTLIPTGLNFCFDRSPAIAQSVNTATVFAPPSNVRATPNGTIICSVKTVSTINIYGSSNGWYKTDVCGKMGYIHHSQIRLEQAASPQTSSVKTATVFAPPSNVRATPNGAIICTLKTVVSIDVYGFANEWYKTDICGQTGYIHQSQIRF